MLRESYNKFPILWPKTQLSRSVMALKFVKNLAATCMLITCVFVLVYSNERYNKHVRFRDRVGFLWKESVNPYDLDTLEYYRHSASVARMGQDREKFDTTLKYQAFSQMDFKGPTPYIAFVKFQSAVVSEWVAAGESVSIKDVLEFAPCNDKIGRADAKLACLDAIESSIYVNWRFLPKVVPEWIDSALLKEDKLIGWFHSSALFHGDCDDCFIAFGVQDNFYLEKSLKYAPSRLVHISDYLGSDNPEFAQHKTALFQRMRSRLQPPNVDRLDLTRFEIVSDSWVLDKKTKLNWMRKDEPLVVNYDIARTFCQSRNHSRLPSTYELRGLYDQSATSTIQCGEFKCEVPTLFSLSGPWFWAGEVSTGFVVVDLSTGAVVPMSTIANSVNRDINLLCVN
jgi:hypothetical protein